jgi:hypothetical protein
MSDEAVKASICPGMGVCHLETGVQAIIPMQIPDSMYDVERCWRDVGCKYRY